jgi:hypothetical protein
MHVLPRLVRLAFLLPIAAALFLFAAATARAAVGTSLYANGLHISTGAIIDPHGRTWVSDHNSGFCRLVDPTTAGPGFIEHPDFDPGTPLVPDSLSTCLGGLLAGAGPGPDASSAPAFYDPTPAAPDSGDERVYVPDGAAPSSEVYVLGWHPDTGLFSTDGTVTMDADPARPTRSRPLAASVGPDGFIYVGFQVSGTLQRFDPDSPNPKAELVARTADGRGVGAVAAGFDQAGRTTVYLAERTGVRQIHPDGGGSQAVPFAVDAPNAMSYDLDRHLLYAGTANGVTVADAGIDHVQRVATDTATVDEYATGFSMIGGLGVRPDGAVMVLDDPALLDAEQLFQGRMFMAGLPASRITAAPAEFTADALPAFAVAGDQALQCSLVPAGADPVWQDCASGTFTPSARLGDGGYVFATRSVTAAGTGIPVTRAFTVDTSAPGAPAIGAPVNGATVDGTPDFAFAGEPGAGFACSLDDAPYAACAPGATFAFDADGAHTLRVRAIDRAGNTSDPSAPAAFTVDVSAPTVTIDSPTENALSGRSPQFSYHAGEARVTYRCRLDDGPVRPCGTSQGYTNVAPGVHTFQVGATDAVGNVGPLVSRKVRVAGAKAGVDDGAGAGATLDGPARPSLRGLRLGRPSLRARLSRARLAREGLRVGFTPKRGTRVVRVRVHRGARVAYEGFVTIRGTGARKVTLRARALRLLAAGRYRLELTPGTSRTALGPATSRTFRVVN